MELEIKAAIYAVLAGGLFWLGWHCSGIVADDKAKTLQVAQDKIVQTQEEKNVAIQQQQAATAAQVQQSYDAQLKASSASNAALGSLLQRVQSAIGSGTVPSIPPAPGSTLGAGTSPSSLGGFNQAVTSTLGACTHDSTADQGWQDWYKGISKQ